MKIKPISKEFYLNPVAQLFVQAKQLRKVLIAGRAFGKSFVNGIIIMLHVYHMPRSRGLFLGATYTQILTNTLLAMKSAWSWFGYKEGVHYVIGRRPPEYFDKPFMSPSGKYDNVISWWQGTIVILASMDRPDLNRGGSNDWLVGDEMLLIDKDAYDRNIVPSIRASHTSLKGKKGHLSETFTSSMPFGNKGKWLLDMEALSKDPEEDIFFIKGSSYHNRVIIGDDRLNSWKRTLSPVVYAIEILNKKMQYGSLFYPSLADRHYYQAENYSHIDKLGFNIKEKRNSRWDSDCNPNQALNISHDWGGFNCITIAQKDDDTNTVKFINAMHVVHPDIIDDLANNFCEYYKYHSSKVVYQWGDRNGNKKEANAKLVMFDQFASILRKNGWQVYRQRTGDVGYLTRHEFFNKIHRYGNPVNVIYNEVNCKDLIISLENAGMKDTEKDKSSERSKTTKPQHATHYTDAHDYYMYWAFIDQATGVRRDASVSFS